MLRDFHQPRFRAPCRRSASILRGRQAWVQVCVSFSLGAGSRRQEDLDLPLAARREVSRRHGLQRRCGHLESRPLFQERQRPVRDRRGGDDARPHSDHGRLPEDRRLHRRGQHQAAGLLLPLYGGLYPVHVAGFLREGGPRLGARRGPSGAGTGPFRLAKVVLREVAELARWDGYWDAARKAKLNTIRLLPIPESTSRVAALRSGQVDWIEVPPPDGIWADQRSATSNATSLK